MYRNKFPSPKYMYIDTHTHIFSKEFDYDRPQAIERAKNDGVISMILPNIDSTSTRQMLDVCNQNKAYCFPCIGLHPTSVKENFNSELEHVESQLSTQSFIAVGEIGIDLYWDKTYIEQQRQAFRKQLQLAKEYNLPVIIHSRNSFDQIFEIVEQENAPTLKGVFHSFTGNFEQYQKAVSFGGFYVGIGGVVTYKNGGVDKIVSQMDVNHILLETDSPYLSPVPLRGKRNESANIVLIAEKVSQLLEIPLDDVAQFTTSNAYGKILINTLRLRSG
jgi:TatD DNase family protein